MATLVAEQNILGVRLARLRKLRALTQRQLGEQIGVSSQTVSNWELGVVQVPSSDLPLVARALGTSVAGLFGEDLANHSGGRDTRIRSRWPEGGDGVGDEGEGPSDHFNVVSPDEPRATGAKPLPIYRWGSLGDPRDRESSPHPDREDYPPAGREHLIGPNGFGVDVRGGSMVGRDVRDGDVCWVNPDRPYRLGDLVLALVTNGDGDSGMVIKTWSRTEVGECLTSETGDERTPVVCSSFKIIGPVVGIQRWFPPDRSEVSART